MDTTRLIRQGPCEWEITPFGKMRRVVGTDAELEPANEFRELFPECETGAEPPFGHLFGVEMLVDSALTEDEEIIFNAGSH